MLTSDQSCKASAIPVIFYESYFTQFYGAQVGLYHLLQHLDRRQYQPLVVCPGEGIFTERIRQLGVEVVVIPLPPDLMTMGGALLHASLSQRAVQFAKLLPSTQKLVQLIKSRRGKLMHCNLTRSVLTGGWAAKFAGIPLIWHIKGEDLSRLDDIAYRLSNRVISVSENLKNMLCQRWESTNKVVTVRDGIPMGKFDPHLSGEAIRREFGFTPNDVVIGTVGSLGPRKRQHTFIEMAQRLSAQCPTARFVIIGDVAHAGDLPYKQQLMSLGQDLITRGHLVLAGWRDDMARVYAALDVFTLASAAEGLPLTVIEAMAMAKPVVSSKTLSATELVLDGQTGFIFPVDDAPAMAAVTEKLVTNSELRTQMGSAARARATSLFSVETMVQGIQQIYEDSLQNSEKKIQQKFQAA